MITGRKKTWNQVLNDFFDVSRYHYGVIVYGVGTYRMTDLLINTQRYGARTVHMSFIEKCFVLAFRHPLCGAKLST